MSAPIQVPPVQDCGLDPTCLAGQAALNGITSEIARGAADLVVSATTWWVRTDSINPLDPAVTSAQSAIRSLAVLVMVASVFVQAIRLILSRKGEPLVMVATGLARYGIVSALGLVLLQSALRAGDALAVDVLDNSATDFAQLMRDVLTTVQSGFAVLMLSAATAIFALIQWILMALRQAGLLVLAAMLPLAASGSLNRATRGWLDRVLVWLVALVAYKPAAAFIYSIGFSYVSSLSATPDGDLATMITGLMVLMLAVIAMPVLLKFFAWSGTQVGGSAGGSGFIGALGAVGMAQGGGGRGAVDRAATMDATGPGSASTAGGQAATGAATAGGTTAGAAAAGPAFIAGAAATGTQQVVRRLGDGMTGHEEGGQP